MPRRTAGSYGLHVKGTLGLITDACRGGHVTVVGASMLVDELHASGMRLPFPRGGFEGWARDKGILGVTPMFLPGIHGSPNVRQ